MIAFEEDVHLKNRYFMTYQVHIGNFDSMIKFILQTTDI